MPLSQQYNIGGVEVYVWRITETVEELQGLVPADCAAGILQFKSRARCAQWLAVRAVIAQRFGHSVRIAYNVAGKPVLEGADGFISVSHTDGYAVLAYSRESVIGVDAELLSRNVLRVAGRFVPAASIEGFSPSDKNSASLVHWCAKEALYKIVGDLGGSFKENISLGAFELNGDGVVPVCLQGLEYDGERDFLAHYSILDELLVVLCFRDGGAC